MYGNSADCLFYWSSRGYSGEPTEKLLRKASVFVDGLGWRLGAGHVPIPLYPGTPVEDTQDREWPRKGAVDVYGRVISPASVPGAVERATYEAAYYEYQAEGALNEAVRGDRKVVQEKFGDVSFTYATNNMRLTTPGIVQATPVIPAVMTILAPVLSGGRNSYGITGVVA
jgi:hypothetical protein